MVDGSGAFVCERFFHETYMYSNDDFNVVSLSKATVASMNITTQLMADEMMAAGQHRSLGFGYAYEILYWNGQSFQYLDNVFYIKVTTNFDDFGRFIGGELESPLYKYLNHREYAVVEKVMLENGTNMIDVAVVGPADFAIPNFSQEVQQFLLDAFTTTRPLSSYFYCIFINVVAPGYVSQIVTTVVPGSSPSEPPVSINLTTSDFSVTFRSTLLESMYQNIIQGWQGRYWY